MITKKRDTRNWNRYRRGKVNVGTYIQPELKKKLEARAADLNISMAALIIHAIEELLSEK